MWPLDYFGKDFIQDMEEEERKNGKPKTETQDFNMQEWKNPRRIIGIILLPIVVILQLRMLFTASDLNPFAGGEVGAGSFGQLFGMSIWWIALYFLLRKPRTKAQDNK